MGFEPADTASINSLADFEEAQNVSNLSKPRDSVRAGTVLIPLSRGKFALIDETDYPLVSRYKWHVTGNRHTETLYAKTDVGGRLHRKTVKMHRLIMNAPNGLEVDHINGDGLDNRRCNLRICSHAQNGKNVRRPKDNTTGYKGVCAVSGGQFKAYININLRQVVLGNYWTAKDAAHAYDNAAREHFGEFASLNFPNEYKVPKRPRCHGIRAEKGGACGHGPIVGELYCLQHHPDFAERRRLMHLNRRKSR